MSRPLLVATICALALVGCGGDSEEESAPPEPPAWNHDPSDPDEGPTAWGEIDRSFEICRTGFAQSPVELSVAVTADLPQLELDYPATLLVVENTGHTIEVPMPENGDQTLTVGDDKYRLLQYHFHAPSEHTFEGESSDAEVHLVHESEDGDVAVIGILLAAGEQPSPLVDVVLESAPEDAGEEVEIDEEHSPLEIVLGATDATGAAITGYTVYPGSLTTPGCTEGVRWIVLGLPLDVSQSTIDRLHELIADFPGYDGYENNNRPTQPLNDRKIERDS